MGGSFAHQRRIRRHCDGWEMCSESPVLIFVNLLMHFFPSPLPISFLHNAKVAQGFVLLLLLKGNIILIKFDVLSGIFEVVMERLCCVWMLEKVCCASWRTRTMSASPIRNKYTVCHLTQCQIYFDAVPNSSQGFECFRYTRIGAGSNIIILRICNGTRIFAETTDVATH